MPDITRNGPWSVRYPAIHRAWKRERRLFVKREPQSWWSGRPTKPVHHMLQVKLCILIGRMDLAHDPRNFFPCHNMREHLVSPHGNISWKTCRLFIPAEPKHIQSRAMKDHVQDHHGYVDVIEWLDLSAVEMNQIERHGHV